MCRETGMEAYRFTSKFGKGCVSPTTGWAEFSRWACLLIEQPVVMIGFIRMTGRERTGCRDLCTRPSKANSDVFQAGGKVYRKFCGRKLSPGGSFPGTTRMGGGVQAVINYITYN